MALFNRKRSTNDAQDAKMLLTDKSPWPVQEAYKALRTNIIYSMPGNECKVIGVTSALQHDGKSINCTNAAISFADVGKKTLLIECDLRLPTVGKKLDIPSVPGLADLLVGQAKYNDTIHRNVRPGLDVLTAGTIPPDPTWLLQSEQMQTLLDGLRKIYEYIFIDLPPVTTVADASIMSGQVDGFLLVVRDGETEIPAVSDMLAQLQLSDAKILGFLYNDVHRENNNRYRHSYSGYYYQ